MYIEDVPLKLRNPYHGFKTRSQTNCQVNRKAKSTSSR